MQGHDSNLLKSSDKISAFQKKLVIWKRKVSEGTCDMFPLLSSFMIDSDLEFEMVQKDIAEHITSLEQYFEQYFSNFEFDEYEWVRSPFSQTVLQKSGLTGKAEEQLAELSSDSALKAKFGEMKLDEFWLSIESEYPELVDQCLKIIVPFSSTYLCETGFSAYAYIKNKYRARLEAENDLRVALSSIEPDINKLCSAKQSQTSH